MDYVSKIDTLSIDSLYSASSSFKYSYNQRDLFDIEVDRYDEEMAKMDVGDSFLIKNERLSYIDSILLSDDSFNQNRFYFSIPFLADTIYYDLFYKEKEEKEFIVSSPVPENEKWQYWHKVNYSDDGYFYIPTPFTFYTGNHGEVNNGEKSWVE